MKGKKTGGRQKGTPNKSTQEMRERVSALLGGKSLIEAMMDLAAENPRMRFDVYKEILPYLQPKLSSMQMDANVTTTDSDKVKKLVDELDQIEREKADLEQSKRSGAV